MVIDECPHAAQTKVRSGVNPVASNVRAALLLCPDSGHIATSCGVVANPREWVDIVHCPCSLPLSLMHKQM